jgi:hypothetical protein
MCSCEDRRQDRPRPRRSFFGRLIRTTIEFVLVYLLLIFAGGTMMRTGHPVAVEAGKLVHTVTLVKPAIYYAQERDLHFVANGLRIVANGVDLPGSLI